MSWAARTRSSRGAEAELPSRRCGRARCTSSSTAAPTRRRRAPSRATGAASTCCARPSCGRRPPPCAPAPTYPYDELEAAWRTVLLHQFHDILPGTRSPGCTGEAEADLRRDRGASSRGLIADARRGRSSARRRARCCSTPAPHARCGGARRSAPAGRGRRRRARSTPRAADDGTVRVLQRAGRRPPRRRRASRLAASTCVAGREVVPGRARRPTCCSCTATPRRSGTPGTSTSTTAGSGTDLLDADSREVGRPRPRTPSVVRTTRSFGSSRLVAGRSPCAAAARPVEIAPTSTGTSGRSCSSSRSRSTCTPTGRRPRSSSGTSTGPPTPTRRGTPPGSRSARTAGCTSASPATASRRQRLDLRPRHHPVDRGRRAPRRRCGCRCCGHRCSRTPRPTRAAPPDHGRCTPGAAIADAVAGRLPDQPAAAGGRAGARRREPLVTVANPAVVVEAVKLAEDRQRRRRRAPLRGAGRAGACDARARFPGVGCPSGRPARAGRRRTRRRGDRPGRRARAAALPAGHAASAASMRGHLL